MNALAEEGTEEAHSARARSEKGACLRLRKKEALALSDLASPGRRKYTTQVCVCSQRDGRIAQRLRRLEQHAHAKTRVLRLQSAADIAESTAAETTGHQHIRVATFWLRSRASETRRGMRNASL